MKAAKGRMIFQFKVTLRDLSPEIWRRILVREDFTLAKLHLVLQAAMGWDNCHLYEFEIREVLYRDPDPDNERGVQNAEKVMLRDILEPRAPFEYLYDFGDGWSHELVLEAVLPESAEAVYPRCVAGARSCPPEDAGGPGGYEEYLEAIADPQHERHEEMMDWRSPFDPEAFSIERVNKLLAREFRSVTKRLAPAAKSHRKISQEPPITLEEIMATVTPPPKRRSFIKRDERIALELNERERKLILEHTSPDDDVANRLRTPGSKRQTFVILLSLADLQEIAEWLAAEANHARSSKLQEELDHLYDRIQAMLDLYEDEPLIN